MSIDRWQNGYVNEVFSQAAMRECTFTAMGTRHCSPRRPRTTSGMRRSRTIRVVRTCRSFQTTTTANISLKRHNPMTSVYLDRATHKTASAKKHARNRRKKAFLLPNAYTIPRRSEKASFTQIRTDFNLDTLFVDSRSLLQLRTPSIDPLCLEILKGDTENSYIHWDGS